MLLLLRSGRLVLAGLMPAQLRRLLDVTATRPLFEIAETVEAARVM
ncbi:hypothetical protein [Streptomyces sp. NPDC002602]